MESQDSQLRARKAADDATLGQSLRRLQRAATLDDVRVGPSTAHDHLLIRAVARIGAAQGFTVSAQGRTATAGSDPLFALARASGVSVRRVLLDTDWHIDLLTPLLGFATSGEATPPIPVVVQPASGRRGVTVWNPAADATTSVSEIDLEPVAFELSPPLEAVGELTYRDVARFSFAGSRREIGIVISLALLISVVGLLTPIAVSHVFGTIVPEGESGLLWAVGSGLVVAATVTWAFTIVQGFAVTRISLRAEQRLQPAVWARVLSLPVSFFRDFASGELTERVLGADQLRRVVSTSTVGVALAATFSLVNVVLMLAYDLVLGLIGAAVLATVVLTTAAFTRSLVRQTEDIVAQDRRTNAHISDTLEGLSTIRNAAAESRAFAQHAECVRAKVVLQARQQSTAIWLHVFYAAVVTLTPALFFAVVGGLQWDESTGAASVTAVTYLAFTAAFSSALTAMVSLSAVIQPLAQAPPNLTGMQPIFRATPEYTVDRRDPGPLDGRIELRDVSFRYSADSRWVLKGCSFVAEPGEFVALVGASGSGKSTVLRLLLGFETPAEGGIRIDDHQLSDVNIADVRSQLGVVLQSALPTGASIVENVVGARPLSDDQVWRALDAAGLGEEVRAMPMGIHTLVAPDGSTLSGGQIQRVLIARALASEPKVLLLDEATSALDDVTQEQVSASIAALGVTRIAVAHRLSTIVAADRIIVLDNGCVAENGTYDELMAIDGTFARLARRQLA